MGDSESRRKLWKKREENNKCIYCGKNEPSFKRKGCEICLKEKSKKTCSYSKNNRKKINQYNLLIKHHVLEKYGGKCNCCGENEVLFLTIDHINNDGNIERNGIDNYNTISFYLKLKKEEIRNDLQVLCWNCNMGKRINFGICPHIEVKKKLETKYDNRHNSKFDNRNKIIWPDDEELIKMCNETSVAEVSRKFGVNFSAVSGRLKRRNKYHLIIKKSGRIKYASNNSY